jgi:hypothetical protein
LPAGGLTALLTPRVLAEPRRLARLAGPSDALHVANKKWEELSPRTRRLIIIGGAVEGLLKLAALIDLARRPATEVRGSKARWALAIILTNSLGGLPIAYFLWGRRASYSITGPSGSGR